MSDRPENASWILGTLLVAAGVANINMSIANVALTDIASALDASQSEQNLIADAFTMALAATVLYLGAVGDRYGRKSLLLWGAAVSVPASLLAAFAPTVEILVAARLAGGVGAALLFPTTLSIISVLWRGKARTGAIALWSGVGGSSAFLGSVVAGALLLWFWWGSVFLLTAPCALALLVIARFVIPADEDLDNEPVDHLGGLLSIIAVAALVLGVQEITDGVSIQLVILLLIAVVVTALFLVRQRTARHPLVDLQLARQPTFLIASLAGAIAFGALIGALYIGQQFTANVLRYDTLQSAATNHPGRGPLPGRLTDRQPLDDAAGRTRHPDRRHHRHRRRLRHHRAAVEPRLVGVGRAGAVRGSGRRHRIRRGRGIDGDNGQPACTSRRHGVVVHGLDP